MHYSFRPTRGRVLPRLSHFVCLLAVCLLTALALAGCSQPPRWNVLLVTFDTTRADHIGCYGNARAQTPNVDRLAAEGVLFRNAFSAVPLTMPSHSTILTGLYPPAHGVRDNGLFVLAEEQVTLAERLQERGWATGAAIGGFPLVAQFGIAQGFEHYDDHLTGQLEDFRGETVRSKEKLFFDERPAARVNDAIMPWLSDHRDEPFFAWVHYYDPHQPQQPQTPYDQLFADNPYLGEIAYADENLGVLLDHLDSLDALDRTIVVMTSDHGEGLGEHRELTHAYLLYNTTQHVPLVVRLPPAHPLRRAAQSRDGSDSSSGPVGLEVATRVGAVDILPTILELLDVEVPDGLQGQSMVRLMRGEPSRMRTLYAESLSPRLNNDWAEQRAIFDENWKYVHGPMPELFDLTSDEDELRNLAVSRPEIAAEMKAKLGTMLTRIAQPSASAAVMPDDETRARLEALGYLQGSGGSLEVHEELVDEGIPPQARIDDINDISRIRQALFADQPGVAFQIAQRLVDEDPANRYYLELLAQAQAQLGMFDDLLETTDRLLEIGSASGTAERLLLYAGQALFFAGQQEEGIRRVEQSLESSPTADGYYVASILSRAAGDLEGSLADLRKALEIDPTHGRSRIDLAARLAEGGDMEGASAEFDRLLKDHPYSPKARYNYGIFLAEQDDYDGGARAFRRAIELDPDYLEPYFALVVVTTRSGRPDQARATYEELAAKAPEHALTRQARWVLEQAS